MAYGVNTLPIILHLFVHPSMMATLIDRDRKHCDFPSKTVLMLTTRQRRVESQRFERIRPRPSLDPESHRHAD